MLILLAPYKFTKYHYIHYELDIFEKKLKDKFEIHDLSNIVNPNTDKIFKSKRHKSAKIFFSINEWKAYFNQINNKYKNLVILNLLDLGSFKSLFIHFLISKSNKTIIQLKSPGLPNAYTEPQKKNNFFNNLRKKVRLFQIKYLIFHFKTKLIKSLVKFIYFYKVYYLVRGNKINFEIDLNSKHKSFVKYHSHDFSRVNYICKNNKFQKPIGVYLDSPNPYFSDDYSIFGLKINYNKTKWYKDLNTFLHKIEKIYSCKVIIIPHPKVKGLRNPYYDKNFKVDHNIDAIHKLIPISKVVISSGASTAIGLAVAYNKKLILTYNDQIEKFNSPSIDRAKFIAEKCNANFVNLNNYSPKKLKKSIDKKKYQNYFYNYITSKNIKTKKNYEILNGLIQKINQ